MSVVIPSRRRVEGCRHVLKLFPGATVVVHEEEAEAYAGLGAELLATSARGAEGSRR